MGATLDFIEIWLKLLDYNYEVIFEMYNKSTKEMFKQIPKTMTKQLIPKQKFQKLMTEIGGGWYMEKINKVLQPPRRPKTKQKITREGGLN